MKRYSTFMDKKTILSSFLPFLIYKFNGIPIKIPTNYFVYTGKLTLKVIWRGKRFRISNPIFKEKNKVGGQKIPNFKTTIKLQ